MSDNFGFAGNYHRRGWGVEFDGVLKINFGRIQLQPPEMWSGFV